MLELLAERRPDVLALQETKCAADVLHPPEPGLTWWDYSQDRRPGIL